MNPARFVSVRCEAAAPRETLVAIVVAVVAGAVVLLPSLGWLFKLVLSGGFDQRKKQQTPPPARDLLRTTTRGLAARVAIALLIIGFGLTAS